MGILAIRLDSREPAWVKELRFGDVAKTVEPLETGDAEVWLESGEILLIERKTVEDLLLSIKDGRLFEQASRLAEIRMQQQLSGKRLTTFPTLLVTGHMYQSQANRLVTERGETQWHWESVNSALMSLQEVGIFISYARDDADYERAVMALAQRERKDVVVYAARDISCGDKKMEFLMGLPGIGEERAARLMEWSGGEIYAALLGLSDPGIQTPLSKGLQQSIRRFMGFADGMGFELAVMEET